MAISTRAGWTLGLGILGAAAAVGVSRGQGDGQVRKAGANGASATVVKLMPAVVGTLDIEAIFQNYEKTKFLMEQLKADAMSKRGQLMAIANEGKSIGKEMEALQPGSKDFKDRSAKLTELKAKLDAAKQNGEMEGQAKYTEIMATFIKEVQAMTEAVARAKGVTQVVRISNEAVNTQDPDSVMAAMSRPLVWSDPNMDLTRHVLHNLNTQYVQAGGPVAKPAAPSGATEDAPASAPSARPAPSGAGAARPAATGRPSATGRPTAPAGEK